MDAPAADFSDSMRVERAYRQLMDEAITRGLTRAIPWPETVMKVEVPEEHSDLGAPFRKLCPSCAAKHPIVRASAMSHTGWCARCWKCDYRWEIRRTRDVIHAETLARGERLKPVQVRGRGPYRQFLYDRKA